MSISTLKGWLASDRTVGVDASMWQDFEDVFGLLPPPDFRSFYSCLGCGRLAGVWGFGMAMVPSKHAEERARQWLDVTLESWQFPHRVPPGENWGPVGDWLVDFLSAVSEARPLVFARTDSHEYLAWRRLADDPRTWDVVYIDMSGNRMGLIAGDFTEFIRAWLVRGLPYYLYDDIPDEDLTLWER